MSVKGKKIILVIGLVLVSMLVLGCMKGEEKTMDVKTSNHRGEPHLNPDGSEKEGYVDIMCEAMNYGDPGYVTIRGYVKRLMEYDPDVWEITDEDEKRIHLDRNEEITVRFDDLVVFEPGKMGGDETELHFQVKDETPD